MKYGFIGTGNMGGALAVAVCKAVNPAEVAVSNRTSAKAAALAEKLGCTAVGNDDIARNSKFIFLGVKPQMMRELCEQIMPVLSARRDRYILVSMAAGITIADLKDMTGPDIPIIRISPNTPVAIGEGIVLTAHSPEVTAEECDEFNQALSRCGLVNELPEKLHAIGGTLSGCGPAFTDMFIEALADGAVACGLPRAMALRVAAQMVIGSGRLLLESGQHPGELKDAVCSPGGTTIQGVRALEEHGFRGAAMDAVISAYEKQQNLRK